ncbi:MULTISPECIES: LysE family transporter [unclassified Iodidimonas]|jgi:L-lysine exporter family protein LysE/ArgO|uniref:LysE/ArgO family amino acid transporter n=1 Tax=unclassified Iodidimonas TaxID=2626145 RepID=UPI002482CEF2|nr:MULTISPECIES: LysE family transporter [unclassified Iodidimonas]
MTLWSFLEGFVISIGLVMAIGPQNAFLLRQAVHRQHPMAVALTCFLADAVLISLGALGAGAFFASHPLLRQSATAMGILFISFYAFLAFRAAARPSPGLEDKTAMGKANMARPTARRAALVALALTLFNPHAYVDTLVLVGGLASAHAAGLDRLSFTVGAVLGSAVWFFGLAQMAGRAAPFLSSPRGLRRLDLAIGIIMTLIALALAFRAIKEVTADF